LRWLVEEDELKDLFVPEIIQTDDEYEQYADFLIDGLALFGETEYVTIFVDDDYSVGLVVCLGQLQADRIEDWRNRSLPPLESKSKFEKVLFSDLLGGFSVMLDGFEGGDLICQQQYYIASTSKAFAKELSDRVEGMGKNDKGMRRIGDDRRFSRSFNRIKPSKSSVGFAYFVPTKFAPLFHKDFVGPATLSAHGIGELVSCSIDFRLEESDGRSHFSAQCHMPTTEPRIGLAALWEAYKPIDSMPPLSAFSVDTSPVTLRIESKDNRAYWERKALIHEAEHGEGTFIKDMDKQYAFLGGFQTIRDFSNGNSVRFWFNSNNYPGLVSFSGIENRTGAMEYQRQLANYHLREEGGYPFQETEIDQNVTSWFRTESDVKKRFIANSDEQPKTDADLDNSGAIVGERWTLYGEKGVITLEDPKAFDVINDFQQEVAVCFPQIESALFEDGFEPSWIEINWTRGRTNAFANIRYQFLRDKYKNNYFKMFSNARTKKTPHIDPKDLQDRVFAIVEVVVGSTLRCFEADIVKFRCDGSNNEWRFSLIPKVQGEKD
jgi:hypothetical protein